MQIEIISPETTIYSGEVRLASFPGINGSFEILDRHAPVVAILKKGKIKLTDNQNQTLFFEVNGGVVEMNRNKIIVLAE